MSANRPKTRPHRAKPQQATRPRRPGSGRGVVAGARPTRSRTLWALAAVVVAGLAVLTLWTIYHTSSRPSAAAGDGAPASNRYAVGSPGAGATAPDFALPNATAVAGPADQPPTIRLSDYRGKTVLLYFHEGLGCQPCWDQIRDLQHNPGLLTSLGVDQLLTITTGPRDLVGQKMRDDGLTVPALVDADLRVSRQYQANQYGMMGTSRDGHSFLLIDPDARIVWRADYGGAPNYTMYVPPEQLAADLRASRGQS
jgi:peroxiredoxin